MKRLHLIDAHGFCYRAFFSLPEMHSPDGTAVNAVYGFCRTALALRQRLAADGNADYIAAIFDAPRGRGALVRRQMDPAYKAHRPPAKPALAGQFALVREAADVLGLNPLDAPEGHEADDLIASYTASALDCGIDVEIISSDKDLMQLIRPRADGHLADAREAECAMYDPLKSTTIGREDVLAKFGVEPPQILDVLAIAGDAADGVPGVPGIGLKGAAALVRRYGSLERAIAEVDSISMPRLSALLLAGYADQARRARELIALRCDLSLPRRIEELAFAPPDAARMAELFKRHGFRSLIPAPEVAA